MEAQIPRDVVKQRFDRLLTEVQTISAQVCAVHTGKVMPVLAESVNDHEPSFLTGRLSNNLLVHFPGKEEMIGTIVDVKLEECRGFYYLGKQESVRTKL